MSAPNNPNNISYTEIVEKGKVFSSPEERYGSAVQIVCDRCQASPITEGYGFGNSDICLPCASRVMGFSEHIDGLHLTFMEQDLFDETRGGNSARTMMQQEQFRETRGVNTTDRFPTTNMQQGIYWRTKMTAAMFDALEGRTPNPGRGGADELQRRLEEMQRLREQPIPRMADDNGIMGYEASGFGGSSLDAQFGSLLLQQDRYPVELKTDNVIQKIPKDYSKPPSTAKPATSSYNLSGMSMTRMMQGMYRTRMVSEIYGKDSKNKDKDTKDTGDSKESGDKESK